MKIITKALSEFTITQAIMEEVCTILTEIDPNYAKEEKQFREGLTRFKDALDETKQKMLEEVVAAEDKRMATSMIYLVWKGLQQNLLCYRNPIEKRFIELDYEDIHREDKMNRMPDSVAAGVSGRRLSLILTEEEREMNPITDYYAYLETVAYKVAHYYGFKLGDRILPLVEPGYCPDVALTFRYALEVGTYLRVDLSKLN